MMRSATLTLLTGIIIASFQLVRVNAQLDDVPSWPHDYPGKPTGDFSPEWQKYFEVTQPLTNVTWELSRNWAGNIPVGDARHINNTLFFWAFEKENGSLTTPTIEHDERPWGIWLDGADVGASSMTGFTTQNGPIQVADNHTVFKNDFSWHHLADWFWIDHIVGVGYSTEEPPATRTQEQVAQDFLGFLENLVKVFPSLKTRPLHLVGESYGGKFISYITKAYFNHPNPPVNLRKIAIGRGTLLPGVVWGETGVLPLIETYPQLIGYDPTVYEYFKERVHTCGYDLNLTYPQVGKLPSVSMTTPQNANVDPYYGCLVANQLTDYALNNSLPFKIATWPIRVPSLNPPGILNLQVDIDPTVFFTDNATRAALHAPTVKNWLWAINSWPMISDGPEPSIFFDDLAANATKHNVSVLLYGRNGDPFLSPETSEVLIQNTTFGGIQGFTRRPATAWYDDSGDFAGVVHQERNWTYVLVDQSGYFLPQPTYERTSTMIREFVVGSNPAGLVTESNGKVTVIGGEDPTLYDRGIVRGPDAFQYWINETLASYTYPKETIEAWEKYAETAVPKLPITTGSQH